MRVFITGIRGQLGQALQASFPKATGGDLPECDITEPASIRSALRAARPELVIHCAAMTDVDGCARDPQAAYRVNALGTQNVVLAAEALGAGVVYISTNEVFDGLSTQPHAEFDPPRPINAYGASKRAGEWFVLHQCRRPFVVRSSWLYARQGRNFVHAVQRRADEAGGLRVVTDEVASPTCVTDLAQALAALVAAERPGIYHLINEGYCSRYDLARAVLDVTGRGQVPIEPITRADYPRASMPPAFTPLANNCGRALGIVLRPWREALADCLGASVRQ